MSSKLTVNISCFAKWDKDNDLYIYTLNIFLKTKTIEDKVLYLIRARLRIISLFTSILTCKQNYFLLLMN